MRYLIDSDDLLEMRDAANESGWIAWQGGECPVSKHALVEVRYRGWPDTAQPAKPAGDWRWRHSSTDNQEWLGDIVAYRVVEDAVSLAEDDWQTDSRLNIARKLIEHQGKMIVSLYQQLESLRKQTEGTSR